MGAERRALAYPRHGGRIKLLALAPVAQVDRAAVS